MTVAFECVEVSRAFGDVMALDGVHVAVEEGCLAAILGPSGCGKTTLLRVIAGFERPDSGVVNVGGAVVAGPDVFVPPERRRVGIVPQEQALFPHLSVAGNIGFGLSKRPSHERKERVDALLHLAGLTGLGGRMPHELSGGQQQRVALARALAPEPSVVLLDEPFGGLDAALRAGLRLEVRRMLQESGTTGVVVTHDQEEALSLADTLAVMRAGRIVQVGAPAEVYRQPADAWVAEFVGGANVIAGRMAGPGRVATVLGELDCRASVDVGAVQVVVRTEQLALTTESGTNHGGPAAEGIVEHREYYGHDALARVRLTDGTVVLARTRSDLATVEGSTVWVRCGGEVVGFPLPTGDRADVESGGAGAGAGSGTPARDRGRTRKRA